MKKIIFEDTTVVKQPYVEINGVEHEVHDGEYQGGTDLDAETFNTIQNNIAGYIDGEESMGSIIVEDIQSKNLLNITNVTYQYGVGTSTNTTVTIPWITGAVAQMEFNTIKNNTDNYAISYTTNTLKSRYYIKCFDSSGNIITNLSITGYTYNSAYSGYYKDFNVSSVEDSFQLPSQVKTFRIGFINNDSNSTNMVFSNPQLEKGTTATDYTEYKEISNKQIYSTNEIVIGEWLGKPLYRKVIYKSGNLTSGSNAIPHGISNLDSVINKNCSIPFYSGSAKTSYGHGTYIDNTQFISVSTVNSTNANINIGSTWANSFTNGCYVILEYTKTTD